MGYDIVFVEQKAATRPKGADRAVGESVFFYDLPRNSKVFVFFYPGSDDSEDVEHRLRELGKKTGDNLFVNIATLADPDYDRAVERFAIRRLPVIVVTAAADFAATPEDETTFVRLDSPSLFARPADLARTVEELFNLYLNGRIAEAVRTGWIKSKKAVVADVAIWIWSVVRPVITWISEKDLSIDLAAGTIEVKASGDA